MTFLPKTYLYVRAHFWAKWSLFHWHSFENELNLLKIWINCHNLRMFQVIIWLKTVIFKCLVITNGSMVDWNATISHVCLKQNLFSVLPYCLTSSNTSETIKLWSPELSHISLSLHGFYPPPKPWTCMSSPAPFLPSLTFLNFSVLFLFVSCLNLLCFLASPGI